MAWVELHIRKVARPKVAPLCERLFELRAAGVQEEDLDPAPYRQPWDVGPEPPPSKYASVTAWFEDPDPPMLTRELGAFVAKRVLADLTWEVVPETDWEESWKEGFQRICIGERLAIAPPWLAEPGDVVVEPGCAFGTGAHPSTLACLHEIDRLADRLAEELPGSNRRLLDVGCGSGILALAGARLGLTATAIDVDEAAVEEAQRNAARNGLNVDWSTRPLSELEGTWDLVVCNLYAEAIAELAPELVSRCSRYLVVAGLLADREELVRGAIRLPVVDRESDGTWVRLRFRAG